MHFKLYPGVLIAGFSFRTGSIIYVKAMGDA
jgi:hypothetical protein